MKKLLPVVKAAIRMESPTKKSQLYNKLFSLDEEDYKENLNAQFLSDDALSRTETKNQQNVRMNPKSFIMARDSPTKLLR